jgi:DNA-binding transcriptional regulator WhiA
MYGLFIGIHCADGSIPKYRRQNKYLWEFRDEFEEAAEFVAELIRNLFGVNPHKKKRGNAYVVYVTSKKFWLFLTQELKLPIGEKSETIDMPETLSKEEWKDFVNGVIGADGTIFKDTNGAPRIRLNIRSKKLRDRISQILNSFGVHHTIGENIEKSRPPRSRKVYERKFYRLDIYGENVIKYFEIFGIWHPVQKRKLESIINNFVQRVRETGGLPEKGTACRENPPQGKRD